MERAQRFTNHRLTGGIPVMSVNHLAFISVYDFLKLRPAPTFRFEVELMALQGQVAGRHGAPRQCERNPWSTGLSRMALRGRPPPAPLCRSNSEKPGVRGDVVSA